MARLIIVIILSIGILLGCSKQNPVNYENAKGQVTYINLEGGFYGIKTDDSKNLEPINLPDEYKIDGIRISFNYKQRTDLASYRMWGIIVELSDIKRIDN